MVRKWNWKKNKSPDLIYYNSKKQRKCAAFFVNYQFPAIPGKPYYY